MIPIFPHDSLFLVQTIYMKHILLPALLLTAGALNAQLYTENFDSYAVGDYIAGMTDRFALAEHRRLLDSDELL